MKTTVSEKGQITIPKPLRQRLGIGTGQILEVREEEGRLVATKVAAEDPVQRAYGILRLGRTTDRAIDELRGRRERA